MIPDEVPVALPKERPPYVAELIPLNQGVNTQWLVSVKSEVDPDDPFAGWIDVNADANNGEVEVFGFDLSPVEARNLALALLDASRHAEGYAFALMGMLSDQQMRIGSDLGPDATVEQSRAVHGWFGTAFARCHAMAERARARRAENDR